MNIKLIKLSVQGQNKESKEINFNEKNTLIQGSSDTGKSYILSAIYYCLGGTDIPKNVGYSAGYTTFILTLRLNNEIYTIVRDYAFSITNIYSGEHYVIDPPFENLISKKINEFFINTLNLNNFKIVTKSGKLGNITLSNLKYFSFFDEDKTLSSDFFLPKKENNKLLERQSLFSFLLTGQDDKNLDLSTPKDEKLRIDGKISVYNAELEMLNDWYSINNIDKSLTIDDISEKISFLDTELEAKLDIKIVNQNIINKLNSDLKSLRIELNKNQNTIDKINDNIANFELLDEKYNSDKERLISILNTHLIFEQFADHTCPLCDSIMQVDTAEEREKFVKGIEFEISKISTLQSELKTLIPELKNELSFYNEHNQQLNNKIENNIKSQFEVKERSDLNDFINLTQKKNLLESSINFSNRISAINKLIDENITVKNKNIKVVRNLSTPFDSISKRCKSLLLGWGISNINNLYISDQEMDLIINQRQRISFGKGKRALFLTAFAISIMEYSLDKDIGHLGFLIIDSPLVTHKDPKYGLKTINDEENRKLELDNYTEITVAQKFYHWLVKYKGKGQVIIIENDAPEEKYKTMINFIEFTGNDMIGRAGFF
ncbi:AAA family ATPase [Acinetobacter pittii]|uniref:AAA family ATPase n=1 Tax=Acinetobacter pittii TaxID=48296 RepID=UPI00083FB429|nr:AAA family ATPase [Acinetobacter pittii]ODL95696.1 hypothetical protein AXH21_09475 [Acinetobacter pittii]